MEITEKQAVWLNPAHPNYKRWQKGRELAKERAAIVGKIISLYKNCSDLDILDLGSGEGETSYYFSDRNRVISYDLSLLRLKRQGEYDKKIRKINGRGEALPFQNYSFDLIILQDVIEHINGTDRLIKELRRVLRKHGIIYISTPNKFSLLNIISDPHWGLPLLSILGRESIKKYFLPVFRKKDLAREDIPGLLSLKELFTLFKDYEILLNTDEIVYQLSGNHNGVLWSSFHVTLFNLIKKSGLMSAVKIIANNKPGFINKFITPTFYLVLRPLDKKEIKSFLSILNSISAGV